MTAASSTLYLVGLTGVLGTMLVLLVAAVRGPTVFDRILAVNTFGTKTVILIALAGFLARRPELYLDLALVYALANFTGTVAVLKVVRFRGLASDEPRKPEVPEGDGDPAVVEGARP